MTCIPVELNGLVMDEATADADGTLWSVTSLIGWFDAAEVRIAAQEVQPDGEIITAARTNRRSIVLEAVAYAPNPATAPLGIDGCVKAIERAKTAGRCVLAPVVLTVTDGLYGALHANVRRDNGAATIKTAILGPAHSVRVQWQLIAENPARIESDNTTTHD